jgi:hypothetical protein
MAEGRGGAMAFMTGLQVERFAALTLAFAPIFDKLINIESIL